MFKLCAFGGAPSLPAPDSWSPPPPPAPCPAHLGSQSLVPWPYIAVPSLLGSRASLSSCPTLAGPESLAGGQPRLARWEGAAKATVLGKLEHWPLLPLLIQGSERAAEREPKGSQAHRGPSGAAGRLHLLSPGARGDEGPGRRQQLPGLSAVPRLPWAVAQFILLCLPLRPLVFELEAVAGRSKPFGGRENSQRVSPLG